ncbi:MAG: RIO1 family regulatory kinase/ATPase [Candidatus Verstraetearchaeota archaeon]|nr:RIO1 family regulatory kinase/ATPase [Candidatus Verstraetearchaeota archaeon]
MARRGALGLGDERLREVFSFPRFSEGHYRSVQGDLLSIGVEALLSFGEVEIGGVKVIGKGCTGIVCLGVVRGRKVALKILRSDSVRNTLEEEGKNLELANSFGVGPGVVDFRRNVIAMEFVLGMPLIRWLEGEPRSSKVRAALAEVLKQCRALDEIGLDHGELSDARKHILIEGNGRARIIDFESASRTRRCRNLTSVVSYLFLSGTLSELLRAHVKWNEETVRWLMRKYKVAPSESSFRELISHLKLY